MGREMDGEKECKETVRERERERESQRNIILIGFLQYDYSNGHVNTIVRSRKPNKKSNKEAGF